MHDRVKHIKNGELQYFVDIVQLFIDSVYCKMNAIYEKEVAINITYKVFKDLYTDIMKSKSWNKEDEVVAKSLRKSCRNYGVEWDTNDVVTIKAPPEIVRKLFMDLSRVDRSRDKKKSFFVLATCFLMVAIICVFIYINSNRYAEGTVGKLNVNFTQVHTLNYSDGASSVHSKSVSNLTNLLDTGVLIEIRYIDGTKVCQIWSCDKLITEFRVPESLTFVSGHLQNDSYVFKDLNHFYNYNSKGEKVEEADINGNPYCISSNKRFIAVEDKSRMTKIFDMQDFDYINTLSETVLSISDKGYLVTDQITNKLGLERYGMSSKVVALQAISINKLIVVYDTQVVSLFEDGNLVWEKELKFCEALQKKDTLEKLNNVFIVSNENLVNIVMMLNESTVFQAYNIIDGTELNSTFDSMQYGSVIVPPIISPDGNVMITQSGDNYYRGIQKYRGEDYTFLINFKESEIKKSTGFENWFATDWVIDNDGDNYYLYYTDYESLRVVGININE